MERKTKIIAMIPARMGSQRLRKKNLVLLDKKPLISYAILAAKKSGIFHRVVVNSENVIFNKIAKEYGCDFYLRSSSLATPDICSDDVVYDFMKQNDGDILAWVNTTSPLQSATTVKKTVDFFIKNKFDTVITTHKEQVHSNFNNKPLNYLINDQFAKTQDLVPVERFVYSTMVWRYNKYLSEYKKKKKAFFVGNIGFYPVDKLSSFIVKTKEDVLLCKYIIEGRKNGDEIEYYQ